MTTLRTRSTIRLLGLVTAVTAGLATVAIGPESTSPTAEAATTKTPVVLAIGDSYTSGEGGGWMGNTLSSGGNRVDTDMAAVNTGKWSYDPYRVYHKTQLPYNPVTTAADSWKNGCHSALAAPVHRVTVPQGMTINFACSGAKTNQIWPMDSGGSYYNRRRPQIDDVDLVINSSHDVRLVVIGAGGNDSGFGEAVRACLAAWAKKHVADIFYPPSQEKCRNEIRDVYIPKIVDVHYNLVKTIDLLRREMRLNGQPDNSYRIVLTGYPSIVPTEPDDWIASEGDGFKKRCPIVKEDAKFINTHFVSRLNEIVRSAAVEAGAGFIDLNDAFVGHRLCEYGTLRDSVGAHNPGRAEWVRFLDVHPSASSTWKVLKTIAHPTTGYWPLSDKDVVTLANPQRHVSESLHPNYFGQWAIGTCVNQYDKATSGNAHRKCVNGGGQVGRPDQMTLTSLPAVTQKVDNPTDFALRQGVGGHSVATVRTIVVPESVKPGHYIQPYIDLQHPRKGQLKIMLIDPQGYSRLLRNYNPADTGAWYDGRWTYDYYNWDPWITKDPSGTWKLVIWDGVVDNLTGVFEKWDLRFY